MSPWALVYPGLSVVFLGGGVRAFARYARSGQRRWFAFGVAQCAVAFDGFFVLSDLLRFRGVDQRRLIWGLVVLSAVAVLVQSWRSLRPETEAETEAEAEAEAAPLFVGAELASARGFPGAAVELPFGVSSPSNTSPARAETSSAPTVGRETETETELPSNVGAGFTPARDTGAPSSTEADSSQQGAASGEQGADSSQQRAGSRGSAPAGPEGPAEVQA